MSLRVLLTAAMLTACAPEPLPEVWGAHTVEDLSRKPRVVEVAITAAPTRVSWLDDTRTKVWAYDDTVPGPTIQARVGDTLRVHFTNDLPQPTTIHWHGIRVPEAMDGVPLVQDPVQPGETFTYEFELPDAGTYWYHPHVRANRQVEKGLYGTLVVHEEEPPPVDRERLFVLDDVALDGTGEFATFDLARAGMDAMHGRHGNVLLTNGQTELLQAEIPAGSVERWRLVNTANARIFYADVANASWRVIAVDGTLLPEPWTQDVLTLPVGRRFDLEVVPDGTGPATLRGLFPNADGGLDPIPLFEGQVVGDAPPAAFLDEVVRPVLPETLPAEQRLKVTLGANTDDGLKWTVNESTYVEGESIPLEGGLPTRIVVEETSGSPHPFHLHGQFFQLLRRDGTLARTPGLLDTVLLEPFETVTLYSTLDNPGRWLAHCHILEHAELGMMTTFEVSEPAEE